MAHERSGSMEIDSDEIVKLEPRAFRPFKTKDEYLYAMKEDLAEWFKTLYEGLEILVDNFFEVLDTGVLLCKHANNVQQHARDYEKEHPGSPNFAKVKFPNGEVQYRENVKPKSFQARDNISNFIAWCRGLGIMDVLLFETDDLVLRKNEKSVILCLLEVARKGAKFGMLAPILVQMEEEIEMEIAGEEPEPFKQIIYNDHMSLDDMVSAALSVCSCPSQFPMVRVSEGKYRVGNSKTLIFVRILRNHVMVRVGGGWDTLQHYLDKHDPCRCHSLGHRIPAQPLPPKRRSSSPVPQPQLSVYQPRHSYAGTPATAANQNRSSNTRRTSATPSRPQTPTLRSSQSMLRTQDRRYRSTENLLSNSRTISKIRPQDLMGKNFPKSMSSDKIGQQTSRRRSDSANLSRPESTEDLRNHRRGGSHPSPRSMSLAPSEPKTRRSPSREEASRQRSRSAATVERTRPSTPTLASGRIRYSPRPNEQEKLIISRNSTGRHILSRKDTDESEKQSMRQSVEIKQSASSSNLQDRQQTAAIREERPPSRIRPTTPQPMKALVRSPQEEKNDTALYITRNQGGRHEVNRDTAEKQENKTTPRRGSTGIGSATTHRSGRHTPVTMDQREGVNSAGQSKGMRSRTPTTMLRQNSLDQDDTKSKPGSLTSPTTSEPGSIYQRRSRPSTPEPALKQGKQPVTPRGSLQGPMGFVKRPENGRRTPTLSRENSETELKEIMANATREISPRTGEPSNSRNRSKTPTSGRRTPNLKRANSVEKDLKDLKSQNDKTSYSASGSMKSPRSRSSSKETLVENNFGSYDGGSNTKKTAGRNSLSAYSFGKPLTRSQEIKLACSTFSMPNNRKFHKRSQSITDPSEHEEIVDEAQKQLEKDFEEMEALFRTYRVEERSQSRNGGRGLTHSSSCNELSALEACDEGYTTQRNELLNSKEKGFISKRNSSMGDLTNFSLSPRMTTYDISIVKPRRDDRAGPPTRIPTPVRPRYGAEGRLLRSDSGVEINCSVSDTYCDDMETRRSTGSDSGIDFKAFNPNEFQRQPSPSQSPTTKVTYTLNI